MLNDFEIDVRQKPIITSMTWEAETMLPNDGIVNLGAQHLEELHTAAREVINNPHPIENLSPDHFNMPACSALMGKVRDQLSNGIGFAIIDRLPVDDIDSETAKKLYWLLMNMVGQTVAQKWDGTMLYDVTSKGKMTKAGNGVRSSLTNQGQDYHVDNSYGLPPDYVGLLCFQTAAEGGTSGLVSFQTAYNIFLSQYKELLPRLYQDFYYERQLEHAPNDNPTLKKPMVAYNGNSITVDFNSRIIKQGYEVAGVKMDDDGKAAINALIKIIETPGLGKVFEFERGQIQIVNNRQLGHRRTAFVDHADPVKRRHLVRAWIRNHGRPFYSG